MGRKFDWKAARKLPSSRRSQLAGLRTGLLAGAWKLALLCAFECVAATLCAQSAAVGEDHRQDLVACISRAAKERLGVWISFEVELHIVTPRFCGIDMAPPLASAFVATYGNQRLHIRGTGARLTKNRKEFRRDYQEWQRLLHPEGARESLLEGDLVLKVTSHKSRDVRTIMERGTVNELMFSYRGVPLHRVIGARN